MLHYVIESTEDKEWRPLKTYALDKSSYKNKCNDHTRDETSMDSNKLGMTRKFLNSQTIGNCAVSPEDWNPSLFFPFSSSFFFFFFTLIILFLLCVNIINFPLLLYVLSVFFLLDCWNYCFQSEHWAGLRMLLLKGTDDEVRCFPDTTSISCIKCTKLHFSERKGSQRGDCIYAGGSKPFYSQYFSLTFSQHCTSLSFTLWGLILHLLC